MKKSKLLFKSIVLASVFYANACNSSSDSSSSDKSQAKEKLANNEVKVKEKLPDDKEKLPDDKEKLPDDKEKLPDDKVSKFDFQQRLNMGFNHVLAIKKGKLFAAGIKGYGQLGNGQAALDGSKQYPPVQIAGTWNTISAGYEYSKMGHFTLGDATIMDNLELQQRQRYPSKLDQSNGVMFQLEKNTV